MALLIEVVDGELKGLQTPAREGLTIGRSRALLTIRDSKLSAQHARVEVRENGVLWLVDAGSSNGIKSPGGRVRELELRDGITFILGRTSFRVIESTHAVPGQLQIQDAQDDVPNLGTPDPAKDRPQPSSSLSWKDHLLSLAQRAEKEGKTGKREVEPFLPAVRLKFTRGIQAGTEWTIGYGPRMAGTNSIDLRLEDQNLPQKCFQLVPKDGGVLLRNETVNELKLNGRWVESEFLKNGDVIDIKSTQIEVVIDADT